MLRQRIILFLIATVVLLGGALLIYGQRTGKLTIFGATPSSPAIMTIKDAVDLQKGVTPPAGDGNTEFIGGMVQLKKNNQLSKWTQGPAAPDLLSAIPAGEYVDYRSYPPTASFDQVAKKFFVTSAGRLHYYDPAGKSWQSLGNNIGLWAAWSNKIGRLVAVQDVTQFGSPASSNMVALNSDGGMFGLIAGPTGFRNEYEEAKYEDPVSGLIVGFRQLDSMITGDQFVSGGARQDFCPRSLTLTNCVPNFPQAVEWFSPITGADNKYSPPQGSGVAWPEARVGATVAYDPIKSEILVFGGFTVAPVSDTSKPGLSSFSHYAFSPASVLWAFDTNSKTWSQRIGSNQPPGRAFSKLTYDQKNKKFIMFGGLTGISIADPAALTQSYAASNDLWSYDPATNAWQLINIPGGPSTRFGSGIGFNSVDQELIVFSGNAGGTVSQQFGPTTPARINDTWTASAGGYAPTGTCQYDVGSPQIQQMFRYQSIKTKDLQANTSISVRFAGSIDGVTFSSFSQPVTYASGAASPDSIDLSAILPANSHFVRVLCTMTSDGTNTPTFEGFNIDYQAVGTASPAFAITPQLGQAPLTVTATRTDSLTTVCNINFGDSTADVAISASQTLSHVYQTVGTFTATMTCDGQTSTQVVTVTGQPSATVTLVPSKSAFATGETVNFTLTDLGPANITMDDSVPFIITNANSGQLVFDPAGKPSFDSLSTNQNRSWFWDQKDAQGAQVAAGAYIVTVPYTIVGQTQPSTQSASFTVQSATEPQPTTLSFTVTPGQGTAPLLITANYAGTLPNLVWDFGDGTVQSASQGPSTVTHTYQTAGTYTVTLRSGLASGSQTVLVSSGTTTGNNTTPILVNGSVTGTTTASSGITSKPKALVSTGANPFVMGLLAAWLLVSATIFTYQPKRHLRS